jgi:Ca2+-binding EF-hand superfamily protein
MRTEALKRVRLVFGLFDADGNGVLEAEDFDLMSARVVRAVPEADEARRRAMIGAFRRYWTTLVDELDANHDNRIDPEEFTACVLSPQRFHAAINDFAEALAAMGDPDGDGLIERPAFVALMTAIGFDLPNIHALFDSFGPDAEDRVTVPTWAEAIREFYDPDAGETTGNHLVTGLVGG